MARIDEELETRSDLQLPDDPANSAQGKRLQAGAVQLAAGPEIPLLEIEVPQTSTPEESFLDSYVPPPESSAAPVESGESFIDSYTPSGELSNESFLDSYAAEKEYENSLVGLPGAFGRGLETGLRQIQAVPANVVGVVGSLTGVDELEKQAAKEAFEIMSLAPQARARDFRDVSDLDSFLTYAGESVGQSLPSMVASIAGGVGLAPLAAKLLTTTGLLGAQAAARVAPYIGGLGVNYPLALSETGLEVYSETGSYGGPTTLFTGGANALLDFAGDWYGLGAAKTGLGGIIKSALVEGGTEGLQSTNNKLQVALQDAKKDFFTFENGVQILDESFRGALGGGAATATFRAVGLERPEVDPDSLPVLVEGRGKWGNVLTHMRDKFRRREISETDAWGTQVSVVDDFNDSKPLFESVRDTYASEGLRDRDELVADFVDAVTPRYVVKLPDGKRSEVMTNTELEVFQASRPQSEKLEIYEVNLQKMNAAGVTAAPVDLPLSANDERLFFAPWVKREEQQGLLDAYQAVVPQIEAAQQTLLKGSPADVAAAKQQILELYAPLANAGLRAIPSRGTGFLYNGRVEGKLVENPTTTGRSRAVAWYKPGAFHEIHSFEQNLDQTLRSKGPESLGYTPVALDTNKVKFGDVRTLGAQGRPVPAEHFWFAPEVKEEEKAQLIEQYNQIGAGLNGPVAALKHLGRKIQIHPKFAHQIFGSGPEGPVPASKIGRGAGTPSEAFVENYNSFVVKQWPRSFWLERWVASGGQLSFNSKASVPIPQIKLAYEKLRPMLTELHATLVEHAKSVGLPHVTVTFTDEASSPVADTTNGIIEVPLGFYFRDSMSGFTDPNYQYNLEELKRQVFQTTLHEYGHLLLSQKLLVLPPDEMAQLRAAYERGRISYGMTNSSWVSHTELLGLEENQPYYSLTFSEWLAEQTRRALVQRWVMREDGKFHNGMAASFKKIEATFRARYGDKAFADFMEPSFAFSRALDYLEATDAIADADFFGQAPASIMKPAYALPTTIPAVEQGEVYEATVRIVEEWYKAVPSGTTISIEPGIGPQGRVGEFKTNDPLPGKNAIRLWVGSLAAGTSQSAVAHEVLHSVWHLLTPGERATLVAAGRSTHAIPPNLVKKYSTDYKRQFLELGLNEQEAVAAARSEVEQEYAAWLFGKRAMGVDFGKEVNGILDRLWEMVQKVKSLLLGRGWNSVSSIAVKIKQGEVAARETRQRRERLSIVRSMAIRPWAKGAPKKNQYANVEKSTPRFKDTQDFIANTFEAAPGEFVTASELDKRWQEAGMQTLTGTSYSLASKPLAGEMVKKFVGGTPTKKSDLFGSVVPTITSDPELGAVYKNVRLKPLPTQTASSITRAAYGPDPGSISINIYPDLPIFLEKGPRPGTVVISQPILDDDGEPFRISYYLYEWNKRIPKTRDPFEDAMAVASESKAVAVLETKKQGTRGWETEWINVRPDRSFGVTGEPIMDEFAKWVYDGKLGQDPRPSGQLYDDGYRRWLRLDPTSVAFHVVDPRTYKPGNEKWNRNNAVWYSPNRIVAERELAQMNLDNNPGNPRVRAELVRWKEMEAKIDPTYFGLPRAKTDFVMSPLLRELDVGLAMAGIKAREAQIEKALRGEAEGPTSTQSEQIMAQVLKSSTQDGVEVQPEAVRAKAVLDVFGSRPPPAGTSPVTLQSDLDKVSWFSKLFFSIKQLAWRNPHISQLTNYTGFIDQMSAFRMALLERANETARAWDRLDSPGWSTAQRQAQLARLNEMLFWATRMDYLPAGQPPRFPTAQELTDYMQRNRIEAPTFALYQRIQSDFQEFLNQTEAVMVENIQRRNTIQNPNGTTALSNAGQVALAKLQADMRIMRMRPYFPFTRFGRYTVTVRDSANPANVLYYEAFDSERSRNAAVRDVRATYPVDTVQVGIVPNEVLEFQGLPGPVLEALLAEAQTPGSPFALTAPQIDWLRQFNNEQAPENSFRKRWLERKGTPGYSLDGFRVYSSYFNSGASYLARLRFRDQLEGEITSLRGSLRGVNDSQRRGQILEMLTQHFKYLMQPSKDWAKFRSFVTLFQLGFSPAAAVVNLTQTPVFTLPYFAGIYGGRANVLLGKITKSIKRAASYSPTTHDSQFAAARALLIQMGKLETGAAPELGAYASGGNLAGLRVGTTTQRNWRSFIRTSMWMFEQAERVNREIVLGLSWELSQDPGHTHLRSVEQQYFNDITALAGQTIDIGGTPVTVQWDTAVRIIAAREAISRTQFEYGKEYRPKFLQSGLMSSFMVFFSYLQSALFAMGNNPGKAQLFLTFALLFGVKGLPGAEDLDEVIRALARRRFGKDFSLEDKARELVHGLTQGTPLDEVGPDLFLHGMSRYSFGPGLLQESYGIPQFDASANGSMGRLVPGLGPALRAYGRGDDWQSVTSEAVKNAAGAGFGLTWPMMQFLSSGEFSDWKKWESVMPRAVKAASKGLRFGVTGEETTRSGATLAQFDMSDPDDIATVIAQGLGFSPTKLSAKWDLIGEQYDKLEFYQNEKAALHLQFFETVRKKDRDARAEVIKEIKAFNAEVKSIKAPGLMITPNGLKSSVEKRFKGIAGREAGIGLSPGATQLNRSIEMMHPGVEKVR